MFAVIEDHSRTTRRIKKTKKKVITTSDTTQQHKSSFEQNLSSSFKGVAKTKLCPFIKIFIEPRLIYVFQNVEKIHSDTNLPPDAGENI